MSLSSEEKGSIYLPEIPISRHWSKPDTEICSNCKSTDSRFMCPRCHNIAYCCQDCAIKHKHIHKQNCNILNNSGLRDVNCNRIQRRRRRKVTENHYKQKIWIADDTSCQWPEILLPSNDEIKKYMDQIYNSPRNEALLSTYKSTKFPSCIYQVIIELLPLFQDDETAEFLDEFPDDTHALTLDWYYYKYELSKRHDIKKRLDWGMGIINRFLLYTKLVKEEDVLEITKKNINLGIRGAINEWIDTIYWYRMGDPMPYVYGRKPGDVVGLLKNGKYFYYKDGVPSNYAWGGMTHGNYFYLVADDIQGLLKQMDKRDIDLFLKHEKEWKPLQESRKTSYYKL